ncbi:CIMIP2 protein GA14893 [Metopolophium dirhodum]|uniref:CIMIP2 protein GA14893 n=1 Tax=Metopolophium dirhodum TaxID=44670 RepID=UPI00298FA627|nr:CIMIP2 protein GA14893 [Metopolophium dirhodum]
MGSIKKILPPQPHYLSGYTGFVPGYKSSCGQSYGKLTHDLFFDKTVKRSNVPVLSDLTNVYDDTICTLQEEDSINKRCEDNLSCKFTTDIIPGYAGYVPQYIFLCGNKYTADATRAINNFVKIQKACSCPECEQKLGRSVKIDKNILDVEAGVPRNVNEYTHPIFKKDLEAEKVFKQQYKPTSPIPPTKKTYFLENGNPHKKCMAGYAGHVPGLLFEFGQSNTPATIDALNKFTDRYVKHKF